MGFWPAKTLLSAVELDLGDGGMTGGALRDPLGLHPRADPDFFDALVATGMLARDGDGPTARYRNSEEGRLFLDFTGADFAGWCREAGFRNVEVMPLAGPASAGVAYK